MEKFCPACSRVYGEDAAVCEVDGERLVLLSEEPSLVGHVLDGKYTLISKLGEGGMGSVYLAEQQTMGRQVAIKVLRREFSQNRMAIKRFLREARAASKLAHHNTITVYDFGQSNDGLLYLVMERLSGRPLADILDQDGALPPERAVHILSQICDSLSEAHKAGITHRDLKPENIFIEEKVGNTDFVKVLDFGIAKMQGDETTTQATAAGMICGTPSYMSPEQAMGKEIDGRSDIYALGVLFYEMLTNAKPFEGDTPMEVMLKHINEPSPDVFQRTGVQIPQGLQEAIDKLLAKKVEKRPQDCQEAKKLIVAGLGTPLVGPVLSVAEVPAARKRRATDDRLQSLERTGLSPAVSAPIPPLSVAPRRARVRWAWVVSGAVLAGVAVLVITLLAGSDKGAASAATSPSGATEARVEPTPTEPAPKSGETKPEAGASAGTQPGSKAGEALAAVQPKVTPPEESAEARGGAVAGEVVAEAGQRAAQELGKAGAGAEAQPGVKAEVEPKAVPEPPRPKVKLTLTSVPPNAEVYEGDALLGTTPLEFERDKDTGPVKLSFKLRGYRPEVVTLGTVQDVMKRVDLKKAGGAVIAKDPPKDPKDPNGRPGGLGGTF